MIADEARFPFSVRGHSEVDRRTGQFSRHFATVTFEQSETQATAIAL